MLKPCVDDFDAACLTIRSNHPVYGGCVKPYRKHPVMWITREAFVEHASNLRYHTSTHKTRGVYTFRSICNSLVQSNKHCGGLGLVAVLFGHGAATSGCHQSCGCVGDRRFKTNRCVVSKKNRCFLCEISAR